MTGSDIASSRNRFSRSMPLISGIRTSVMTQPDPLCGRLPRKVTALS
jgi:hypothetical protein